jgi:hypothetical protein
MVETDQTNYLQFAVSLEIHCIEVSELTCNAPENPLDGELYRCSGCRRLRLDALILMREE